MKKLWALTLVAAFAVPACGVRRDAAWDRDPKGPKPPVEKPKPTLSSIALEAWAGREDRAQLEKAIGTWEQIVAQDPSDATSLTYLSRAYFLLADHFVRAEGNRREMMATFEKGIASAERAMVAVSPEFEKAVKGGDKVQNAVKLIPKEGQPAVYWYATNLGRFAVAKGTVAAVRLKEVIYEVMQHVLTLDETYLYGAPHRYFGAFFARAPGFAGGNIERSKEHFESALAINKEFFGTKVLYAEYYAAKVDDQTLYRSLLQDVVDGNPESLTDVIPEQKFEQAKARDLLAKENAL